MEELKTPLKLFKKRHLIEGKASQEIPASPLMKRLGYGTGIAGNKNKRKKFKKLTKNPFQFISFQEARKIFHHLGL